MREKEEQLRMQRKKEEIERWWAGAEIYKPRNDEEKANNAKGIVKEGVTSEMMKERTVGRYTMDYSKWDTWIPDDEVTRQEQLEKEKEEEEKRNKEFEQNNPDFCKQFMVDLEERKKSTQKKQESADILRLKGNRFFKSKEFVRAVEFYMDALKNCPFDCKLLLNIAQAQIKLKTYDDALEFLSRTLYLEPTNVKALSRKAFVLAELGRTTEALTVVNEALVVEPTNIELIAQQREISVIEDEKRQEEKLKELSLGKSSTDETKESGENLSQSKMHVATPVETDESKIMHSIDNLKLSLDKFLDSSERDSTWINQIEQLTASLNSQPLLRVHFRNSGIIPVILNVVKSDSSAMKSASINVENSAHVRKFVGSLLGLLNIAIDEQRSSKQLVIDQKGYTALKILLDDLSGEQLNTLFQTVSFVHVLCKDDICTKSRAAVFSDKSIISQLSNVIGNLNHNLQQSIVPVTAKSNEKTKSSSASIQTLSSTNMVIAHQTIKIALQILKLMLFAVNDPNVKTMLTSQDSLCATTLVCATACTLHHYYEVFKSRASNSLVKTIEKESSFSMEEMLELAIEVMLGLSQLENMRSAFTVPLPLPNMKEGEERSAIYTVIQVIKTLPVYSTNAIAILMNSSLSTPAGTGASSDDIKVKQVIFRDGGLDIATSDLHLSEEARKKVNDGGVLFARKAGLMSRLVSLPEVQTSLMESSNYRMICRRIYMASSAVTTTGGSFSFNKWAIDEQLHFIRVLAALPSPSDSLKQVAVEEKIFQGLLSLFPKPREECGEITPTSVTLVPIHSDTISPQLIGNAARCLMPYADDQKYGPILYKDNKLITIEKWICAMATCTDMRVRKNIAILLAKACRIPGIREKVTHFRGLQMMIELQDKL